MRSCELLRPHGGDEGGVQELTAGRVASIRASMRVLRAIAGFLVAFVSMLIAKARSSPAEEKGGVVTSTGMAMRTERDGRTQAEDGAPARRDLPSKDESVAILEKMLLIRRFEERAGEM